MALHDTQEDGTPAGALQAEPVQLRVSFDASHVPVAFSTPVALASGSTFAMVICDTVSPVMGPLGEYRPQPAWASSDGDTDANGIDGWHSLRVLESGGEPAGSSAAWQRRGRQG